MSLAMHRPALSSETVHASCVVRGDGAEGRAVLLAGRSGAGKSDLALRLLDRGWALVSDDYTLVRRIDGHPLACAPATIAGRIEVRGLGILPRPHRVDALVALVCDLDMPVPRLPDAGLTRLVAGVALPMVALAALEPSAPLKVELALDLALARHRAA